jgi:serine/threonine protein kinase
MAPNDHKQALPPGTRLQEYRIESLLGHGAFGITYLALDTRLSRQAAIKEYFPVQLSVRAKGATAAPRSSLDSDAYALGLQRFLGEARALAGFTHPNIVRVQRFFEANGTAYLVMDFESGKSLTAHLAAHGPTLDQATLLAIFLPVLDGLRAVHQAGLLHRDIKPDNIYLRAAGSPMLIDFGAARQTVAEQSRSITAVLTPGYAPIEQYTTRGNQGPWTDLYGIGACLYRCIHGDHPIAATDRQLAVSDGKSDPLVPASAIGRGRYAPELLEAIDWALALSAKDRPRDARAFQQRLLALETPERKDEPDRPSLPTPDPDAPVSAPAARQRARHPWRVGALLMLLLAAVGGLGLWWLEHGFPEPPGDRVAELRRQLQQHLEQRQYTHPADDNALADLETLARLAPDDPAIAVARRRLSEALQETAETALAAGDTAAARAAVAAGRRAEAGLPVWTELARRTDDREADNRLYRRELEAATLGAIDDYLTRCAIWGCAHRDQAEARMARVLEQQQGVRDALARLEAGEGGADATKAALDELAALVPNDPSVKAGQERFLALWDALVQLKCEEILDHSENLAETFADRFELIANSIREARHRGDGGWRLESARAVRALRNDVHDALRTYTHFDIQCPKIDETIPLFQVFLEVFEDFLERRLQRFFQQNFTESNQMYTFEYIEEEKKWTITSNKNGRVGDVFMSPTGSRFFSAQLAGKDEPLHTDNPGDILFFLEHETALHHQ